MDEWLLFMTLLHILKHTSHPPQLSCNVVCNVVNVLCSFVHASSPLGTSSIPGNMGNVVPQEWSVSILGSPPTMHHGAEGPPGTHLVSDPYFARCYLFRSKELFSQIVMSSSAIRLSLIKTNLISRNNNETQDLHSIILIYIPSHMRLCNFKRI